MKRLLSLFLVLILVVTTTVVSVGADTTDVSGDVTSTSEETSTDENSDIATLSDEGTIAKDEVTGTVDALPDYQYKTGYSTSNLSEWNFETSGTYKVSNKMTFTDPVVVSGSLILYAAAAVDFEKQTGYNDSAFFLVGAGDSLKIYAHGYYEESRKGSGIEFYGNVAEYSTQPAIICNNATELTLENVGFRNIHFNSDATAGEGKANYIAAGIHIGGDCGSINLAECIFENIDGFETTTDTLGDYDGDDTKTSVSYQQVPRTNPLSAFGVSDYAMNQYSSAVAFASNFASTNAVVISNCEFNHCHSINGAGIAVSAKNAASNTFNISDSSFEACDARQLGGAIYVGYGSSNDTTTNNTKLNVEDCTIGSAGTMDIKFLNESNVQETVTISKGNSAEFGGGIYSEVTTVISGSKFVNNSAKINNFYRLAPSGIGWGDVLSGGGGVYISTPANATSKIVNTSLTGNTATTYGGAVLVNGGKTVVSGATVSENKTTLHSTFENYFSVLNGYGRGAGIAVLGETLTAPMFDINLYNNKVTDGTIKDSLVIGEAEDYVTNTENKSVYDFAEYSVKSELLINAYKIDDSQILKTTISENEAAGFGGGLYVEHSDTILPEVKILNAEFTQNEVFAAEQVGNTTDYQGYGGGIASYAPLTISDDADGTTDVLISDNRTSDYGGGIYFASLIKDKSKAIEFNISGATIRNNEVTQYSGGGLAVWIDDGYSVTNVTDTIVKDNSASASGSYGGGLHVGGLLHYNGTDVLEPVYPSVLNVIGGVVSGNTAGHGAGIQAHTGCTLTVDGTEITGNTATGNYGGGVFANLSSNSTIKNAVISNNTVSGSVEDKDNANITYAYGSGVYSRGREFNIENTTISGNTFTSATNTYGGALYTTGSENDYKDIESLSGQSYITNTSIKDSTISNHTGVTSGAGIYTNGTLALDGTTITGNKTTLITENFAPASASYSGGAVFATGSNAKVTVSSGSINNNQATQGAGIAVFSGATAIVGGATTSNTTTYTYGGYYPGGAQTEVTKNVATYAGGGAYIYNAKFALFKDENNRLGFHSNTAGDAGSTSTWGDDLKVYPPNSASSTSELYLPKGLHYLTNGKLAYWFNDYGVYRVRSTSATHNYFETNNTTAPTDTNNNTYAMYQSTDPAIALYSTFATISIDCTAKDVFKNEYSDDTEYTYKLYDSSNNEITSEITVYVDGTAITNLADGIKIKNGQTINIGGLNPGTYTIKETISDDNNFVKEMSVTLNLATLVANTDYTTTTVSDNVTLDYISALSTVGSYEAGCLYEYVFEHIVYAAEVNLKYYARTTVNNQPADMESTPRTLTTTFAGEEYVTKLGSETARFNKVITDGVIIAGDKKLDTPIDEYIVYGSQAEAEVGVAKYAYPSNDANSTATYGSVNSSTDKLTYRLDQHGKVISGSTEKWVTYKDISDNEIIPTSSTTTNSENETVYYDAFTNAASVTSIDVWLFNTPKEFTVRAFIPTSVELQSGNITGGTNVVSDTIKVYYNQRLGGAQYDSLFGGDGAQDESTAHLDAYGLNGYLDLDIMTDSIIADRNFLYWSSDPNGNEVLSTNIAYRNRITQSMDLYAIYGDTATSKKGLTMQELTPDYYTENGVKKLKLNAMLTPYGFADESAGTVITDVSALYVLAKGTKQGALSDEAKKVVSEAVESFYANYTSIVAAKGNVTSDFDLASVITEYIVNYSHYHAAEYGLSDKEIAALGSDYVVLTNKNRIQFSMSTKLSSMANNTILTYGAIKTSDGWIVSDNCIETIFDSDGVVASSSSYTIPDYAGGIGGQA